VRGMRTRPTLPVISGVGHSRLNASAGSRLLIHWRMSAAESNVAQVLMTAEMAGRRWSKPERMSIEARLRVPVSMAVTAVPGQRVGARVALGGLEDSGRLHAPDQAVNQVGLDELRDGDAVAGKVAKG
jgi:hypothetical protein